MGADQFFTFGMTVTEVMPDFKEKMPVPAVRDSLGVYPVWNYKGETVEIARIFMKKVVDLVAAYPEHALTLREWSMRRGNGGLDVEVTHHDDGKYITVQVGDCGDGLVLSRIKNPIGRCLTVATARPTPDGRVRGAFDDLVWVQLARHEMQTLVLEAAADAVEAPYILPMDVADVPVGPKAVIRTNNPAGASRLNLNVPPEAFSAVQHFKDEMQYGAIVPEAMAGAVDASVITGRGLQELAAGYSQQIAWAQATLTGHFEQVAVVSFMLDEALWPNEEKRCEGHHKGTSYSLAYTPAKDIAGYHHVDVTYGTSTGLDPNRHLIYILQQLGSGMMSKVTAIGELPGDIDAETELAKVQIEQGRDAIMAAVGGLAASIPGIVAQGGDVSQTMKQVAEFVNGLEKGKPIEDLAVKIFAPPPPPETPAATPEDGGGDPLAAMLGGAGGGAGAPPGGDQVIPGQESGQRPDIAQFFAGMTSNGNPNLGANVARSAPAY